MKQYNNGQRPTKMYGGGMMTPRKPMQMGGLAQQNRKKTQPMAKNMGMGMTLGGAIKKFEKKSTGGKTGAKPDYLDFDKDGNKEEPMKQALAQRKAKS